MSKNISVFRGGETRSCKQPGIFCALSHIAGESDDARQGFAENAKACSGFTEKHQKDFKLPLFPRFFSLRFLQGTRIADVNLHRI